MKGKKPKSAAEWDYAALWNQFPLPARPCEEELGMIEKEIGGWQDARMLILGTTNEYRKLAKKMNVVPYVADFSRQNYEALTSYCPEKFGVEYFMQTDWLQIDEPGSYDCIVGHRCINCIRPELIGEFFRRMHRALSPGGVFFCRANVLFPEDRDRLEEIVSKWAFNPEREHPLFTYLEVELYFRCAHEDGFVDYSICREKVNKWYAEKRMSKEDYELASLLVSFPDGTQFRGKVRKEELEPHLQNSGFSKVEWLFTSQEFSRNMPIIKLTK
jgi:SAM-dependent methyltransferase